MLDKFNKALEINEIYCSIGDEYQADTESREGTIEFIKISPKKKIKRLTYSS